MVISALASRRDLRGGSGCDRASGDTWEGVDCDRIALCSLGFVVDVVKGTGKAVVEDGAAAERERAVPANTELTLGDSTGLNRRIKLKLMVGGDVSDTSLRVQEVAVFQGQGNRATAGLLTL